MNYYKDMYRPLWIEISLKALKTNVAVIKKVVGKDVGILATVKQNAYGHGLVEIARELCRLGVHSLGVGSLEEAIRLRKAGVSEPILILTALPKEAVPDLIAYNVTPTVTDIGFAKKLNDYAARKKKQYPVHVKVDTGMGRIGFWHEHAVRDILRVKRLSHVDMQGIFTHYPVADSDREFTGRQIDSFNRLLEELQSAGIHFKYIHTANSMALWRYRRARFNLVRPGLILYGAKPHSSLELSLSPLLTLKSRIVFLKSVPAGRSIGYGRTFIARTACRIATCAVGYADGYPWRLSNKAKVIVSGNLVPLCGRVCMDHIMIRLDKTQAVSTGTPVTLIGSQKGVSVSAGDLARWAGTIPYEIVTRLSPTIPRLYR